jgi:bis(5'-nucleosidyl)-tetraphosphatase
MALHFGIDLGTGRSAFSLHALRSVANLQQFMARQERSAGVIVFHTSADNSKRSYLLLDYGKHWDFPKGHVEKRETDLDAAIRELEEETGITRIELVPDFARSIVYFFRHSKRGLVRKEVMFFLAETKSRKVTLSHEHVGHIFLPFDEAIARLTYPNAKQVLRDANEHLEKSGK